MDQTVLERTDSDPKAAYGARIQRMRDAVALKQPDRVPFYVSSRFWAARRQGMTCEQAMYDGDGLSKATKAMLLEFDPDFYQLPHQQVVVGAPLETLGFKAVKWPGHGVHEDVSFQYLDTEFMSAEEYDEYLTDPTGFTLRKYLPRIADALEPMHVLPDFPAYYHTRVLSLARYFADPGVQKSLKALEKAGQQMEEIAAAAKEFADEMADLGFPLFNLTNASAPFDQIADYFRGSKGAMLDMFRNQDKLLAAMEKARGYTIRSALDVTGGRQDAHVFMPLHWGLDGFMSEEQFKTFYWPPLRSIILELIENGAVPYVFWEGVCDSRLEIIADIPAGKAIYKFESTDIKLAKDVLGDTVCIQGNVPASMLVTGTPDDVDAYCKEIIEYAGKGGGFILDGACGVPDESRYECVAAMAEAARKYGQY